jgi:hypothetical protein
MWKIWPLTLLATACAGDGLSPDSPALHDLVTCSKDWNAMGGTKACERACEDPHPTQRVAGDTSTDVCAGTFTDTRGVVQTTTCYQSMQFDYRGVRGCCGFDRDHLDNGGVPIRFAVCD